MVRPRKHQAACYFGSSYTCFTATLGTTMSKVVHEHRGEFLPLHSEPALFHKGSPSSVRDPSPCFLPHTPPQSVPLGLEGQVAREGRLCSCFSVCCHTGHLSTASCLGAKGKSELLLRQFNSKVFEILCVKFACLLREKD